MASVRPSGDTPTDIDVPSLTVTSTRVGAGAAANATMKRRLTPSLIPIRIVTFVVALVGALALMGPHLSRPLSAQSKATATNVPVIPHEAVPNFFKNPPGIYTGENMPTRTWRRTTPPGT